MAPIRELVSQWTHHDANGSLRQVEEQMKRLEGKVAVVTGGNSGIGLATAMRFHEEGARVAITGRNAETLQEAVKAIGNSVVAVQADVAKLPELDKLYATVAKKLGRIDVLFVNAGVARFTPVTEMRRGRTTSYSTSTPRGPTSRFRRHFPT